MLWLWYLHLLKLLLNVAEMNQLISVLGEIKEREDGNFGIRY